MASRSASLWRRCLHPGTNSLALTHGSRGERMGTLTTSNALLSPPSARHLCTSPTPTPTPTLWSSVDALSRAAADNLQAFHEALPMGCAWSVTIPLTSLLIRALSLPLLYHQQLHGGRARVAAREDARIQHFVRRTPGTLLQKYRAYRRLRALALRSAGTSAWQQRRWHLAVHAPLVLAASLGMRELSTRADSGWRGAALAWVRDMGAADGSGALPLLTAALWLWNLEPGAAPRAAAALPAARRLPLRAGRFVLRALQVVSVASLPVTTQLPGGLVLFWGCNALLTAALRAALRSDALRRRAGLLTEGDLRQLSAPPVIKATGVAFEQVRGELGRVQTQLLSRFSGRRVDDGLVRDVNRVLRRERMSGRMMADLKAVIRTDDHDGNKYLAVVRSGGA